MPDVRKTYRVPVDAFHRAECLPFLSAGARPGDLVVLDDDGTVGMVRSFHPLAAARVREALRALSEPSKRPARLRLMSKARDA